MSIRTAKYSGRCANCGRVINVGDKIDWESGAPTIHAKCPEVAAPVAAPVNDGEYRQIAARFDSKCSRCNVRIHEGDPIMYRKGEKSFHASHVAEDSKPEAPRNVEPEVERPNAPASREEQHGRYIDAGPNNWDDRDPEPDSFDW